MWVAFEHFAERTGLLARSEAASSGSRPSATTVIARSRSVIMPTGRWSSSTRTTEPTLRSRISPATSRTDPSGETVTTDGVITPRMSMGALYPEQNARVHARPDGRPHLDCSGEWKT